MVYAAVGVGGSQKGETYRVLDCGLIGPFDITAVSQYLWAYIRWGEEPEQGTGNRCFNIFSPPRLVLCAKWHVCLAWLIKHLLCRLNNSAPCDI